MLDRRSVMVALTGGLAAPFVRPSHAAALAASPIGSPLRLAPVGVEAVNPVVTPARTGGYFAAWASIDSATMDQRWYTRRFESDGTPRAATSFMDGGWDRVDIAPLGNRRALAFGDFAGPLVRMVSAAGTFGGPTHSVTTDTNRVRAPIVTPLAGGFILLVWNGQNPASTRTVVFGRILAPDLGFKTAVFRIQGASDEIAGFPLTVAPLADGGAIIGMESETPTGPKSLFRRISSIGTPVGPAFAPAALAATTSSQVLGACRLPRSKFAIAWAGSSLEGRIYDSAMTVIGSFGPIPLPSPDGLTTLSVPMTYSAGRIVVMLPSAGLQVMAVPVGGGAPVVTPTTLNTTSGNVNDFCVQPDGVFVASSHHDGTDGYESYVTRFTIA